MARASVCGALIDGSSLGPKGPGPDDESSGPPSRRKWETPFLSGTAVLERWSSGKTDEERIQLNEENLLVGRPYSRRPSKAGRQIPSRGPTARSKGLFKEAHISSAAGSWATRSNSRSTSPSAISCFGSRAGDAPKEYRHELDSIRPSIRPPYSLGGVRYTRQVFASPIDQVLVIRPQRMRRGRISLPGPAERREERAHSNYATDYFRMDGFGPA